MWGSMHISPKQTLFFKFSDKDYYAFPICPILQCSHLCYQGSRTWGLWTACWDLPFYARGNGRGRLNATVTRKACFNFCHLASSGRGGQKWQCVVKESCVQAAGFSVFKVKILLMGTPFWEQLWSSWHLENITYCFSVYPVVDTSDDVEWAESV